MSSGPLPTVFADCAIKGEPSIRRPWEAAGGAEEALQAGEQLRENRDSVKLAALQKAQEVESLSQEGARLIRQPFSRGNEIADLKEQCDERQAEIERLNEVIALFWYPPLLNRFKASERLKTHHEWQGIVVKALGVVSVAVNLTETFRRSG